MGEWTEERDAPVAERLAQVTDAVAHASDLADAYWLSRPNFVTVADIRDLRAARLAERARAEKAEAEVARLLGNAMPPEWERSQERDAIKKLNQALRSLEAERDDLANQRDALKDEVERLRAAPTTIPLGELKRVTYVSRMATPSELTDEVERLRERVATLEAVLAEPSEEEVVRLRDLFMRERDGWRAGLRSLFADLRQRASKHEPPAPTGVEPPLAPPEGTPSSSGVSLARWRELGHVLTTQIQAAGWPGGGLPEGVEWLVARVAALEAVLAEPDEQEAARLAALASRQPNVGLVGVWPGAVRAILADRRQRAGVTS